MTLFPLFPLFTLFPLFPLLQCSDIRLCPMKPRHSAAKLRHFHIHLTLYYIYFNPEQSAAATITGAPPRFSHTEAPRSSTCEVRLPCARVDRKAKLLLLLLSGPQMTCSDHAINLHRLTTHCSLNSRLLNFYVHSHRTTLPSTLL